MTTDATDGPGPGGLHLTPRATLDREVDALAERLAGRVGLAGAAGDLDRRLRRTWAPGRAVHRAWTWERSDRLDLRWWPQGVTTIGDAGPEAPPELSGRRLVLVSWYAKRLPGEKATQGARVSVLDLDARRYRHVLLVVPTLDEDGTPGLEPLQVHAGGIVWRGRHLHVAATGRGFWTCRLDDVLRMPDWHSSPALDAFGYRYVLPVHRLHAAGADEGTEPLRYSYCSVDHDTGDLVVGEYATGTKTRRLTRLGLDPSTGLPGLGDDGTARPLGVGDGVRQMQGAVPVDGRWHVTTSHGRRTPGSVWTGEPGSMRRHRWAVPMGPEDLTHWPGGGADGEDLLLTVTEHPWARWVCAMRTSWFDRRA